MHRGIVRNCTRRDPSTLAPITAANGRLSDRTDRNAQRAHRLRTANEGLPLNATEMAQEELRRADAVA